MSSNQNNRGLETIPFQIVNQSGLDAPLYIWIQGIIPDKKPNEYVFANDLKGNVADMPKSLTKATFSMLLPAKDTTIAFGYDDVCEQSSVGITKNPTNLVLTVHPLAS